MRVTRRTQLAWVADRAAWTANGGTFATWMEARRAKRPEPVPETPLGAAFRRDRERHLMTGRAVQVFAAGGGSNG